MRATGGEALPRAAVGLLWVPDRGPRGHGPAQAPVSDLRLRPAVGGAERWFRFPGLDGAAAAAAAWGPSR
jgi:hypothetical protein